MGGRNRWNRSKVQPYVGELDNTIFSLEKLILHYGINQLHRCLREFGNHVLNTEEVKELDKKYGLRNGLLTMVNNQ